MRVCWLLAGTALAIAGTGSVVQAQEVDSGADDGSLMEIIVTAQKRATRLIDVPQAVTAVSAADLARANATQLRDITDSVPGLIFTTSGVGQSQLSMRGVTTGADVGPTVGIYIDEVPYGSSSAFANAATLGLDAGLFDLDRVEVLRGPQGTLYGASAMGGVLRYITPMPSLFSSETLVQGGLSLTRHGGTNYNGAAAVAAPLVEDRVGGRVSAYYNRDAGFIDDVGTGEDDVGRSRVYGARVDFLIQATDDLSIRLTGFGQNVEREGSALADYSLSGQPVNGGLDQRRVKAEPFDQDFRVISGTINNDFGDVQLTAISSFQTVDTDYRMDISSVYVPLLGSMGLPFGAVAIDQSRSTDKFTQELRLASAGDGFVEWIAGGFFTHEKTGNVQQTAPYDTSGALSSVPLGRASLPSTYEEIAGFGNVTLHLTDAFDVTGGLRYARNDQSFEQIASGLLFSSAAKTSSHDDVVTYLANARYRFDRHNTLYARFATGYRPGGPNFIARDPVTGASLAPASFKADTLQSYELGYKGETDDGRYGVDAAVYHIDWQDIQAATAAGGMSVIVNTGKAKVDGFELAAHAQPVKDVTVTGSFAYQDARLSGDEPLLGAEKGDRLPNVPRYSLSLSADYEAKQNEWRPMVGASLHYVSDRYASFDANAGLPQYRLPDYLTVDLRTGVTIGAVDARLFVRNLTDRRGQLSAQTSLSVLGGPAQVAIMQPRTVGLSLSAAF